MKVVITPRARRDLREIYGYLSKRSPQGAENVLRRIREAFLELEEQPEIGVAVPEAGARRLYVGRYPYMAYYRLLPKRIDVVHIRHTSRADPGSDDLDGG